MKTCKRCGENETSTDVNATQLLGQYKATLCCDCINVWHEYVMGSVEYLAFYELLSDLRAAEHSNDHRNLRHDIIDRIKNTELALYNIAKDWAENGTTKDT